MSITLVHVGSVQIAEVISWEIKLQTSLRNESLGIYIKKKFLL